jgi:hypothetical protein
MIPADDGGGGGGGKVGVLVDMAVGALVGRVVGVLVGRAIDVLVGVADSPAGISVIMALTKTATTGGVATPTASGVGGVEASWHPPKARISMSKMVK